MSDIAFYCGPAKGTADRPYRCICCRRAFADMEQLAVSICWECMSSNLRCQSCRERGIFVNDSRIGRWDFEHGVYETEGGLGHRYGHLEGRWGVMACGERIPRRVFGAASGVVPWCPKCWAQA